VRTLYTWGAILLIVATSTAGDCLISRAMKQIGDLGDLRRSQGLLCVVRRVATSPAFLLGFAFMVAAFFSLLVALSWADVSLVAPASASLTFISSAIAAKLFLHERVDGRRWLAALLVAAGVALVAA
jgi:drug/metabolite transporter (DMT)-like permease